MEKPSVFISYAHMDARRFTERLAFDLERLMDIFWDIKLQAGEFPEYLQNEIERREFFIAIMSPYSEPEDKWCRQELRCAEECHRKIIPLKIYRQHHDGYLEEKYTYADFTEDYNQGFRRLTFMIVGQPFSSWEYLSDEQDDQLILDHLEKGRVPGLIAKEVGEWALVDRLWASIESRLVTDGIIIASPRTLQGILAIVDPIHDFATSKRAETSVVLIRRAQEIIGRYLSENENVSDSDHMLAGQNAMQAIASIREEFQGDFTYARRDVKEAAKLHNFFTFDVAEKIRELIILHSRRSRYLY